MSTIELIARLQSLDVRLWVDEDQLCYSAAAGAVAPALRAELIERKEELLTFLREVGKATSISVPAIVSGSREGRLPLSFAQQRLWFLDRLRGTSTEYNLPGALRLRGELDLEALERTINTIVERHESLRTHFAEVDGEPEQVIEKKLRIEMPLEDLSDSDEEKQQECLSAALREEANLPFDLARGPLLRMRLLKLGRCTTSSAMGGRRGFSTASSPCSTRHSARGERIR
jgi:Condensation domain/TubC N-terminal docking domain